MYECKRIIVHYCFMCLYSLNSVYLWRMWLYAISLMLCLMSLVSPSGPYGSQRTTWPHRITCKYLLYASDNTQARCICRGNPVFSHRQARLNLIIVMCLMPCTYCLPHLSVFNNNDDLKMASDFANSNKAVRDKCLHTVLFELRGSAVFFPEEGGTQRIL